jgi:hypothetical protein
MPLPTPDNTTANNPEKLSISIRPTALLHLHKQRNHPLFIPISPSCPERLSPAPVPNIHNHLTALSLVPNTYLTLLSRATVPYFCTSSLSQSYFIHHCHLSLWLFKAHITISYICPLSLSPISVPVYSPPPSQALHHPLQHLSRTIVPDPCPKPEPLPQKYILLVLSILYCCHFLLSQLLSLPPVYLPSPISLSFLLSHPSRPLSQTLTSRLHTHHFVV